MIWLNLPGTVGYNAVQLKWTIQYNSVWFGTVQEDSTVMFRVIIEEHTKKSSNTSCVNRKNISHCNDFR